MTPRKPKSDSKPESPDVPLAQRLATVKTKFAELLDAVQRSAEHGTAKPGDLDATTAAIETETLEIQER